MDSWAFGAPWPAARAVGMAPQSQLCHWASQTGTSGVPTEGLGFVWEPREVRGVWAQGWLLSLLNPVFCTAAAGQSRGQLASFSGFVVTTPKAFPRPQVYSSPHSTEQGGFPALAALFL